MNVLQCYETTTVWNCKVVRQVLYEIYIQKRGEGCFSEIVCVTEGMDMVEI